MSLFILLLASGLNAQIITIGDTVCKCFKVFNVSPQNEPREKYRIILSKYIYNAMFDNIYDIENKSLNQLFERRAFKESMIFLLSDESSFLDIFYEDYANNHERWNEYTLNLLYNCSNKKVLYQISNELIDNNNDKGLLAFWNSLNINKIKHYSLYKQSLMNKNDLYKLSELVIIFHNSKNIKERNELLEFILHKNLSLAKLLQELMQKNSNISYVDYLDKIYWNINQCQPSPTSPLHTATT